MYHLQDLLLAASVCRNFCSLSSRAPFLFAPAPRDCQFSEDHWPCLLPPICWMAWGTFTSILSLRNSEDAAAHETMFLHLAGLLRKERKGVISYLERRPFLAWITSCPYVPSSAFNSLQSKGQSPELPLSPSLLSENRRKTSCWAVGRRRETGGGLLPATRPTVRRAGNRGAERAAPPRGRHRPAPAPPPRRLPSVFHFHRRSGKLLLCSPAGAWGRGVDSSVGDSRLWATPWPLC